MLELGSSLPGYVIGENKAKMNRINCIFSLDWCSYYALSAYGGIPKPNKMAPALEHF